MPPLTAHFSAPFKIPSVYVCFTAVRINTPLRTEFEVFVAPDVPAIAMKHVPVCSWPANLFYTTSYSRHGFWLDSWITNTAPLKLQLANFANLWG